MLHMKDSILLKSTVGYFTVIKIVIFNDYITGVKLL